MKRIITTIIKLLVFILVMFSITINVSAQVPQFIIKCDGTNCNVEQYSRYSMDELDEYSNQSLKRMLEIIIVVLIFVLIIIGIIIAFEKFRESDMDITAYHKIRWWK